MSSRLDPPTTLGHVQTTKLIAHTEFDALGGGRWVEPEIAKMYGTHADFLFSHLEEEPTDPPRPRGRAYFTEYYTVSIDVAVCYDYLPSVGGSYYQPSEPAQVIINEVTYEGQPINLDEDTKAVLTQNILREEMSNDEEY